MDKTGRAMWTAGVTCPSQTLHRIVVTTKMQCRREVKSLCKELIAEGFSAPSVCAPPLTIVNGHFGDIAVGIKKAAYNREEVVLSRSLSPSDRNQEQHDADWNRQFRSGYFRPGHRGNAQCLLSSQRQRLHRPL